MKIVDLYHKYCSKILDGPDWFYTQALEKRPGNYRSITAAIMIWLFGFYSRIFTVPAQFLAPTMAVIVLYSIISWNSPMRYVAILIFIIFLIDFIFPAHSCRCKYHNSSNQLLPRKLISNLGEDAYSRRALN